MRNEARWTLGLGSGLVLVLVLGLENAERGAMDHKAMVQHIHTDHTFHVRVGVRNQAEVTIRVMKAWR